MLLEARSLGSCSSFCGNSSKQHHAVSTRAVVCSRRPPVRAAEAHVCNHSSAAARTNSNAAFSSRSSRAGNSSSSSRSASIICRDAPRPMWARGPAPKVTGDAFVGGAGALAPMVTKQISEADSIVALSDVYSEWGGSFDYIHTAAALVKFAKLSRRGGGSKLVQLLVSKWMQQLPEAGARACANALWACVNLGKFEQQISTLWAPTWEAFMQHTRNELETGPVEALKPQTISSSLYAAAKLRRQPSADELQLLVQAFLRPDVLAAVQGQDLANLLWAISKLCQLPDWQGGVSEQDVQQMLGKEQLLVFCADARNTSNMLLALGGMAAGKAPVISSAYARDCCVQILAMSYRLISNAAPHDISNVMWCCGEVGLVDEAFMAAVVATAPRWVPRASNFDISQVATACARMQYKNAAFLQLLLQQGLLLVQQQGRQNGRSWSISAEDKSRFASQCSNAVARLDMQQFAGVAMKLVVSSGVGQQPHSHVSSLRRLWVFHCWLLQQQLLDGKGLAGVLTQQQLQQGEKEAAAYGDGV